MLHLIGHEVKLPVSVDVTDFGLPVSAVVTVASVHNFQVTIPLEKISQKKLIIFIQ